MVMTHSAQLERETEQTRARVEQTLDELRARMSPGQLLDQASGYFRTSGGRVFVDNLRHQVVDNPLPVTLIGAGIAWLALSGAISKNGNGHLRRADDRADRRSNGAYRGRDTRDGNGYPSGEGLGEHVGEFAGRARNAAGEWIEEAEEGVGDFAGRARNAAGEWIDEAKDAVGEAGEAVRATADQVKDRASHLYDETVQGARRTADRVADFGRTARHAVEPNGAFMSMCREQPMLVAGLGLLVGAALGAMLPTTRVEGQVMGEASRGLKSAVKGVAQDGIERAEDAFEHAKAVVTDELQQGLDQVSAKVDAAADNQSGAPNASETTRS